MAIGHSLDVTIVYLPDRAWHRLFELATRATGKHISGGWQNRLRRWCTQMNEADRSVVLSHTPGSARELDDMTFLERAIVQKNVGGWQRHAFNIFAGSHPRFTGLTILPRPPRKRKQPYGTPS